MTSIFGEKSGGGGGGGAPPTAASIFGEGKGGPAKGSSAAAKQAQAIAMFGGHHSLLENLSHDIGSSIHGIPSAIKLVGGATAHDVGQEFTRSPLAPPPKSEFVDRVLKPALQQEGQQWGPLAHGNVGEWYSRFHAHPLNTALDVMAFVTAGGSRALAVADEASAGARLAALRTGNLQGPLREITVRGAEGGGEIATRTLPRNALHAARAQAADRLLKSLPPETRVVGEFARAARAARRTALPTQLRHLQDTRYEAHLKAFAKLTPDERLAANVIPRLPLGDDLNRWIEQLPDTPEGRQTVKLLQRPGFQKAYHQPSRKVLAAIEAGRALSHAREEILLRTTPVDPETLAASPFRHTRTVRGAKIVEPTPARLGIPNAKLVTLGKTLDREQAKLDRLIAKGKRGGMVERPRTAEEGSARLDQLERERAKAVDQMAYARFGPVDMSEVRFRSRENAKARRQASGLTRSGRASGASGVKAVLRPTVKEERRQLIERSIADAMDRNPDHPVLQRWAERDNEIGQLRDALNPSVEEAFGDAPRAPRDYGTIQSYVKGTRGYDRQAWYVRNLEKQVQAGHEARLAKMEPTGFVGGGTPDELRAEIEAAGRPQPYYIPDEQLRPRRGFGGGSIRGGGWATPPRKLGDIRQSELTLFRMGQLALHPDSLKPAFFRAAEHDYKLDLHEQARTLATPVARGHGLPVGYRWLREKRGERIPATETGRGAHVTGVGDVFPDESVPFTLGKEEGETGVAQDEAGRRLAISETFARTLEAHTAETRSVLARIVRTPLTVWRALVLHLRIPWLVNNVVGNTLMATLNFAGVDGLKAFLGMVGETRGAQAVRRLIGDPVTRNHLTEEDMRELLPEQLRGTFIGTQLPTGLTARLPRVAQRALKGPGAVLGALPRLDKASEQALRRASAETILRGSPEVKAFYKAMPAQTRSWRAAMREGLKDPKLNRLTGQQINDALGDFLNFSPVEQNVIRQVIPFYPWYREIVRITGKLALNKTMRTAIFAKLTQIANQQNNQLLGPLPSYLQGDVGVGAPKGDIQQVLALNTTNPYSSTVQVGQALGGLVGIGNRQAGLSNALSMVSPLIAGPVQYAGQQLYGHPRQSGLAGLPAAYWQNVIAQLPQVRLGTNPPSKLYPGRTREQLIEQYLGDPRRYVSRSQAATYASEGK